MTAGDQPETFEALYERLQTLTARLEAGNLPLESSIELFEQGVLLQRRCEKMLSEAELRFQRLVEQVGDDLGAVLELGGGDEGGEAGHIGQAQDPVIRPVVHAPETPARGRRETAGRGPSPDYS